jgi:BirA family biotin operon repressor/biotin-[acetyl-CoA-carboxylase] ligase
MKWPNDVLVEGRKVAGILGEIPEPGRVILGIGLNVWEAPDAIDPATVTALSEWGLSGQDAVARAVESFVSDFLRRVEKGGDQLGEENREFIREHLATVGQSVRVSMPDGSTVVGVASDVDRAGRLVVTTASGDVVVSAGDIEHLRTAQ